MMSKRLFQRLLAALFIVLVLFIDIPGIFKDALIIILSISLFISTFDIKRGAK